MITYSKAKPGDAKAVTELLNKLVNDGQIGSGRGTIETVKEIKGSIKSRNRIWFTAKDGKKIVGFIQASTYIDHTPKGGGIKGQKRGNFDIIGIHNNYQKQGIGQQLYELIEQELKKKKCTHVMSWTEPENKKSKNFHDKLGFKEVRTAIQLEKKL